MGTIHVFLTLLALGLLLWLILIWIRRRLYAEFPYFFVYVAASVVVTVARALFSTNYPAYFKVFWATEAVLGFLSLLALHEAFRDVFVAFYERRWFWLVFPGIVAILSAVFIGDVLLHPPAQASAIVAVIISFGKVVNYLRAGVFAAFFLLVWLLMGKGWRNQPFGIVLGFAVSTVGSAAAYQARSIFGTRFNNFGKYGPPVAYILAVLIWIGTCFQPPETEHKWAEEMTPEQMLTTIRQYLRALRGKRP
jgi:hypothetical protein